MEFWKENKIFEKSLKQTEGKKEFIFYEGPPTANGKPGIHHLEARAFKDAIPRYKTMQDFHVRRKGGWDTHGLPVELQVEKSSDLIPKRELKNMVSRNLIKSAKKCLGISGCLEQIYQAYRLLAGSRESVCDISQ